MLMAMRTAAAKGEIEVRRGTKRARDMAGVPMHVRGKYQMQVHHTRSHT